MSSTAAHRALLRQPVSRRRELALQFAVLVGLAVLGGLLILTGTLLHRGDARWGRREAALQLGRTLLPGEQVLARVDVAQRHWYDHFRLTSGILAATDRRLLYVGTAPPALFRSVGEDPPTFLMRSFTYDTSLAAQVTRALPGTAPDVVVDAADTVLTFAVVGGELTMADSLVGLVQGRREARLAEIQRERAIFDSVAALPPPPPEVHRVRPGESLYGLARQYNVTPEVLRSMNGLTSDRIRIGQDIVVRRYRRINGAVVEYHGPPG